MDVVVALIGVMCERHWASHPTDIRPKLPRVQPCDRTEPPILTDAFWRWVDESAVAVWIDDGEGPYQLIGRN